MWSKWTKTASREKREREKTIQLLFVSIPYIEEKKYSAERRKRKQNGQLYTHHVRGNENN